MTITRFAILSFVFALVIVLVNAVVANLITPLITTCIKSIHDVVGRPAPYLLLDIQTSDSVGLFSPILLGLALASTWLSWPHRIATVVTAVLLGWLILMFDGLTTYSPYLPWGDLHEYLRANILLIWSLPLQIVVWLVLCGIPQHWNRKAPTPADIQKNRMCYWQRHIAVLLVAFMLVITVVILIGLTDAPVTARLRTDLAEAIAQDEYDEAIKCVFDILVKEPNNINVIFLGSRLARDKGYQHLSQIMLFQVCSKMNLKESYYREYEKPPRWNPVGPASDNIKAPRGR